MVQSIGVTGNIGSGKSTVCRVFKMLGAEVFEADQCAKQLYDNNGEVITNLTKMFGDTIRLPDGKVDRKRLAEIIFNDKKMLDALSAMIHPYVWSAFTEFKEINNNKPYIIHEAAILYESGFHKKMDYTILVTAPQEESIERVMIRDNITREKVLERLENQWDVEKKIEMADFILENDNKNMLIPKIIEIDENLKRYGKIW